MKAEIITAEKVSLIVVMVPFQKRYFSSFSLKNLKNLMFLNLEKRNQITNKTGEITIGRIEEPRLQMKYLLMNPSEYKFFDKGSVCSIVKR